MREWLPSLPALRVFEAAARHLSFTRAAGELHVTQAAVSHQVRVLEDQLGQALFRRTTRRLELTEEGRRLLPAVSGAFEMLGRAVGDLRRRRSLLSVTTTPFFGARWLAPRLRRFAELHPSIELSVRHTPATLDLVAEGIDVAIRGGGGNWPGLDAERLISSVLVPVAAPGYVRRLGLASCDGIARATLLHDETSADWAEWLTLARLDPALAGSGPVVDDESVVLAMALDGQGVALAAPGLVADELAAGMLVPVFDLPVPDSCGYHLAYPAGALAQPKVRAFRDFVMAEARRGEGAVESVGFALPPSGKML